MSGVQAGVFSRRRGRLLKTGQTTQYSDKLDDGYYKKGLAKAYTVLSAGQYSGTVNIDLVHLTAIDIAFDAATKKITSVAGALAIFKTNDIIVVTGSASNNGVYTVAAGDVAAEIVTLEALVNEAAGASVSIAKREAHSNNCVLDQNTGLMYSRYIANKMGAASGGKLPWYDATKLYNIFAYCVAANAASLGGYTDWRIPNDLELKCLCDMEAPNALPDAAAFPSWPTSDYIWSATTIPINVSYGMIVHFNNGNVYYTSKTTAYFTALLRGS